MELAFDPEVEPLVTQLLNRDPSLTYEPLFDPVCASDDEPPFSLGLPRHERKILETLREIHEEKTSQRNAPVRKPAGVITRHPLPSTAHCI
jgi:hypothetical protein